MFGSDSELEPGEWQSVLGMESWKSELGLERRSAFELGTVSANVVVVVCVGDDVSANARRFRMHVII